LRKPGAAQPFENTHHEMLAVRPRYRGKPLPFQLEGRRLVKHSRLGHGMGSPALTDDDPEGAARGFTRTRTFMSTGRSGVRGLLRPQA
jgi:hypothetical protein